MQGRFLGNSGELNPEIWDAANVRFCLRVEDLDRNPRVIIGCSFQRLWHPKGPRTHTKQLDLNTFCYLQRIFDLDTKVPHGARHIRVSQQQLDGSKILGLLVDQCRFAASH